MSHFVISDIHGAHKALLQCFERAAFNYKTDSLICLGDTCDGWPDTVACFNELLNVNHLVYVLGNHDAWLLNYLQTGNAPVEWRLQGGSSTLAAYARQPVPQAHVALLQNARHYYVSQNRLFVHGGFDLAKPLTQTPPEVFLTDRQLVELAYAKHPTHKKISTFDAVYIGHTPTIRAPFNSSYPVTLCEVVMMDTGAGHTGCLTLMNLNTGELYQSDNVKTLYPGLNARQAKPEGGCVKPD